MTEILRQNLLSPIALAFALGMLARVMRSEFQLPKDIYTGISIYLLLALGLEVSERAASAAAEDRDLPGLRGTELDAFVGLRIGGLQAAAQRGACGSARRVDPARFLSRG